MQTNLASLQRIQAAIAKMIHVLLFDFDECPILMKFFQTLIYYIDVIGAAKEAILGCYPPEEVKKGTRFDIALMSDTISRWIIESKGLDSNMPEVLTVGILFKMKNELDFALVKKALDIVEETDKNGTFSIDVRDLVRRLKE